MYMYTYCMYNNDDGNACVRKLHDENRRNQIRRNDRIFYSIQTLDHAADCFIKVMHAALMQSAIKDRTLEIC